MPEEKKEEPRTIFMDGNLFYHLSLLRDEISDPENRKTFEEQLLRAKTHSLNYASKTLDYLLEEKEESGKKEKDTNIDRFTQIPDRHQLANVFSTLNLLLGSNLNARLDIEAPQFTKEEFKKGNIIPRKLLNRIDVAAMQYAFSQLSKYRELTKKQGKKPEEALQELDLPPGLAPEEIENNFLKKIDQLPSSVSDPLLNAIP